MTERAPREAAPASRRLASARPVRPSAPPVGEPRFGQGPYAKWTEAFLERVGKSPRQPRQPFYKSDIEAVLSQTLVLVAKGSGPLGTGQAHAIVEMTGLSRGLTVQFLAEVTERNRSSGELSERLGDLVATAAAMERAGLLSDVPSLVAVLNGLGQAVAVATQEGQDERLRKLDAVLGGIERTMRAAEAEERAARPEPAEAPVDDADALADYFTPEPEAAKPERAKPVAPPRPAVGTRGGLTPLEATVEEIEGMVGQAAAKRAAADILDHARLAATRKELALKPTGMARHVALVGNTGTGKSAYAALVARMYGDLGLLSKGHVAEVLGADLVDRGGPGLTPARTRAAMERARGGILLVDRPDGIDAAPGDPLGQEAVETLARVMRDPRCDIAVALAGPEAAVAGFLAAHPDLAAHVPRTVRFADYDLRDMLAILARLAKGAGLLFDEGARVKAMEILGRACAAPGPGFRNGHLAQDLLDAVAARQSARVLSGAAASTNASHVAVRTVTASDVAGAEVAMAP